MQRKFFILLAVVVTLNLSCQQELDIEQPLILHPKILSVEPNPAKPGDVITITGQNFSARYWENILWIGAQKIHVDSGTASKLFTRAPLGIRSGILSSKTATDSVTGPTLTITPTCSSQVCLGNYAGPPITDSSSWVISFTGLIQKWSATLSGDTVTLAQFYGYGDDSAIRKTIRFLHRGNTTLPLYVYGTWTYVEIQGNLTEPLQGHIAVERWSIPGVLSGHVSTYLSYRHYWEDFNFYAVIQ